MSGRRTTNGLRSTTGKKGPGGDAVITQLFTLLKPTVLKDDPKSVSFWVAFCLLIGEWVSQWRVCRWCLCWFAVDVTPSVCCIDTTDTWVFSTFLKDKIYDRCFSSNIATVCFICLHRTFGNVGTLPGTWLCYDDAWWIDRRYPQWGGVLVSFF